MHRHPWGAGKRSKNYRNRQRTLEKQKEPPTLWNWEPQGPSTIKSGGNSDLILLALASDFLGARGRAFLVALIKQLSSFGFWHCFRINFSNDNSSGLLAMAQQHIYILANKTIVYTALSWWEECLSQCTRSDNPRLKLTAASVSVHLGEILRKEIDEKLDIPYQTDSIAVLQYVSNSHKWFQVFVTNRVQMIHNLVDLLKSMEIRGHKRILPKCLWLDAEVLNEQQCCQCLMTTQQFVWQANSSCMTVI